MADSGARGSVRDSSGDPQRGVRHALVTGGIGDIGAAIGRRLARDGFHVTLLDRRDASDGASASAAVAEAARVAGDRVVYAQADVTDRGALDAARAARVVPLGELQTADQVAGAVGFLCSPDAAYMTGSTLLIDGGASLFAFD